MSRPAPGGRNRRSPATPDILVDARTALGEGPVWDDQQQRLLWVDILPGLVYRFDPATGGNEVFGVGKPVGAVGLRREGGLVIAVEDGFALLDQGWQRLHQVAVIKHTGPRGRFNDGKCDPAGRFLAGTMAYDLTPGACLSGLASCAEPLLVRLNRGCRNRRRHLQALCSCGDRGRGAAGHGGFS